MVNNCSSGDINGYLYVVYSVQKWAVLMGKEMTLSLFPHRIPYINRDMLISKTVVSAHSSSSLQNSNHK